MEGTSQKLLYNTNSSIHYLESIICRCVKVDINVLNKRQGDMLQCSAHSINVVRDALHFHTFIQLASQK